MLEILGKIYFVQENIPAKIFRKRRKIYWYEGVNRNSQSVKYANVTISSKGPAHLRWLSCWYVERSLLHFVLWLELFSSSKLKHMASNWPGCIYGVRRRETAPSLAALWLGRKKTRVFWHQSETRTTPTVWNWSVKTFPRGSSSPSSPEFFSPPFRLFPGPTNCPWVSEDEFIKVSKKGLSAGESS